MSRVTCFAVGAISALCLAAQTPPAKPAQSDQGTKTEQPQSLPPGPIGLQPALAPAGETESKPPADAADPNKMAAPAPAGAPVAKSGPVDVKTYVIGAEDVLRVLVWNHNDISGEFVVRPDGRISMPLIGDMLAADKTPEELGSEVSQKLRDGKILLTPNVSVQIVAVHSKKFFIEGEVNRPGAYDLVVPTTVMQGLVNAGGFRDFANQKRIVVLRDGGKLVLRFNYKDVSRGKHLEENVVLQPGDHIIVH
jgi:polysaccharide export outer membrane protein